MNQDDNGITKLGCVNHDCDKCKAQQQEPVAWMHNNIEGNVIAHRPIDIDRHPERWTALYPEPKPCPTCEALARTVMMDQTAHDTPPASKPWVGLTRDERMSIINRLIGQDWVYALDAIEAKLREKNAPQQSKEDA